MAPKGDLVFTETFLRNLLKEAFIRPPTNIEVGNVLNMLQEHSDEILFMRMPKFEVRNIERYLDRILSQLKKIVNLLKGKISKKTVWRCLETGFFLIVSWFRWMLKLLCNYSVGSLKRNLQHYWDKLVLWAALVSAISIASYNLLNNLFNRWFSREVAKATSLVAKEVVRELNQKGTDFVTAYIKNNEHDASQVSSSALLQAFSEILPIIRNHIRHDGTPSGCFSLNNDDENAALAFLKDFGNVKKERQSGTSSAVALRDSFKVCLQPGSDTHLITVPEAREHEEFVLTIIDLLTDLLTAQKNVNENEVVKRWNPYTVVEVDAPRKTMALSSLQFLSDTYIEIKQNERVQQLLAQQNTLLGDIVDYGFSDGFLAHFDRFFNDKEFHRSLTESDFLKLLEETDALQTKTRPFLDPLLHYLDGNVDEAAATLREATQDDSCGPSGCVNSFPTNPFQDVTDIFIQKMCLPNPVEVESKLIDFLPTFVAKVGWHVIMKPIILTAHHLKLGKKNENELPENQQMVDEVQPLLDQMALKNYDDLQRLEEERRWQAQPQGQGQLSKPSFYGPAANAWNTVSGLYGNANMSALPSAARTFANLSGGDDKLMLIKLGGVSDYQKEKLKKLEWIATPDATQNELRTNDDIFTDKFYWFVATMNDVLVGYLVVSDGAAHLPRTAQADAAQTPAAANVNQDGAAPAAQRSRGDNTSPGSPQRVFDPFENRGDQGSAVRARDAGATVTFTFPTIDPQSGARGSVGAVAKTHPPLVFYDLVIHPDYREDGIGLKLIKNGIKILQKKYKSRRMIVKVEPNDTVTQTLYSDAGFVLEKCEYFE